MSNLLPRLLVIVAFVSLSAQQLFGTAYTWNVVGPSNWTTPGNWSPAAPAGPPTTGDTGTIGSGTATVNATLAGNPAITVTGTGVLRMSAFAGALTAGGTVAVNSGGRINYEGASTSTSLITLGNGAILARPISNAVATSSNALSLSAGATVTATNILGSVTRSSLGLRLEGPLTSADNAGTLLVQPAVAGQIGVLVIAPPVANSGFIGNVSMQQGPGSNPGVLALSGAGALSAVNNVTIGNGGILRFVDAVDPFASAKAISVPSGGPAHTNILFR